MPTNLAVSQTGMTMTAEIINLNKVRKARARAERTALAAENRVKFGRSKAERKELTADGEKRRRELDGTRRDPAAEKSAARDPGAQDDDEGEERLDPGTVS